MHEVNWAPGDGRKSAKLLPTCIERGLLSDANLFGKLCPPYLGLSRPLVLGPAHIPSRANYYSYRAGPTHMLRHWSKHGIRIVPSWVRTGPKSQAMGLPTGLVLDAQL